MILCEHQILINENILNWGVTLPLNHTQFFFFVDFQLLHISKQDGEFFREARVYIFHIHVA